MLQVFGAPQNISLLYNISNINAYLKPENFTSEQPPLWEEKTLFSDVKIGRYIKEYYLKKGPFDMIVDMNGLNPLIETLFIKDYAFFTNFRNVLASQLIELSTNNSIRQWFMGSLGILLEESNQLQHILKVFEDPSPDNWSLVAKIINDPCLDTQGSNNVQIFGLNDTDVQVEFDPI